MVYILKPLTAVILNALLCFSALISALTNLMQLTMVYIIKRFVAASNAESSFKTVGHIHPSLTFAGKASPLVESS